MDQQSCKACGKPADVSMVLFGDDDCWHLSSQMVRSDGDLPIAEVWFCRDCIRVLENNFRDTLSFLQAAAGKLERKTRPHYTSEDLNVFVIEKREKKPRAHVQVKSFEQILRERTIHKPLPESYVRRMSSFSPTYEDMHAMIQGIAHCEIDRAREKIYDPREWMSGFLADCVYEKDFEKLVRRYKIPWPPKF